MPNCTFCYQTVNEGQAYHGKCCKRFFGIATLPALQLDDKLLTELARKTVNQRIAITGVQPKLSISLQKAERGTRLTIVGLWGEFILKPQHEAIPYMPETEDLTMHLANLFGIKTCNHCLLTASDGRLVYLAKRFDRVNKRKIHIEDFCQLGGFQTEQKYHSSYERCGKLIFEYCTNKGLDIVNYFELLVFSFLSGNNDMHLKNFAVLHQDEEIVLSPAFDLINAKLIYPEDKEDMALLLNGRKSKIKRNDFEQMAVVLHINKIVFERIMEKFTNNNHAVHALIDASFLPENHRETYKKMWDDNVQKLL